MKKPWPTLRLANNTDREDVNRLVIDVLKEYGLKPDPASTDADLQDIESSYFERGGTVLVLAEKDGSHVRALRPGVPAGIGISLKHRPDCYCMAGSGMVKSEMVLENGFEIEHVVEVF